MAVARVRFAALIVLCVTFAGCGGSSGTGGSGGGGDGGGNGSPTTVTVTFTGGTPSAVATQIGSEPFTSMTPTSNTVSLTLPTGMNKFAVAYVCQIMNGSGTTQSIYTLQNVIEASTLDGNSFTQTCATATTGSMGTLTGSVDASAISGVSYVGVTAGNGSAGSQGYIISGSSSNFSLMMPTGSDRVAVGGYVFGSGAQLGTNWVWTLAGIRDFEGVTIPGAVNGGNAITLGASDVVAEQPITYNNIPSGFSQPVTTAFYIWKSGGLVWLSNALTTQYPAVPAAAAQIGDFYSFQSSAGLSQPSGVSQQVWAQTTTTSNGPLNITFPVPWNYAGPAASAQPVFDISGVGLSGRAGVAINGEISWNVGSTAQIDFSVLATANHLDGETSLTFPSLSGLTGFSGPPASGTQVVWYVAATKSSSGALQPTGPGWTIYGVANSGLITVP